MSESIKRNYVDPDKTVWLDPDGTLHVDTTKICEVLGIPPTRANQDMVERQAKEVFSEAFPSVPITVRDDLL